MGCVQELLLHWSLTQMCCLPGMPDAPFISKLLQRKRSLPSCGVEKNFRMYTTLRPDNAWRGKHVAPG